MSPRNTAAVGLCIQWELPVCLFDTQNCRVSQIGYQKLFV